MSWDWITNPSKLVKCFLSTHSLAREKLCHWLRIFISCFAQDGDRNASQSNQHHNHSLEAKCANRGTFYSTLYETTGKIDLHALILSPNVSKLSYRDVGVLKEVKKNVSQKSNALVKNANAETFNKCQILVLVAKEKFDLVAKEMYIWLWMKTGWKSPYVLCFVI